MKFDDAKPNWNKICKTNILGPFAPKSSLFKTEKNSIKTVISARQRNSPQKSSFIRDACPRISIIKLLQQKTSITKKEEPLRTRVNNEYYSTKKKVNSLRNKMLCDIYCGTRVSI